MWGGFDVWGLGRWWGILCHPSGKVLLFIFLMPQLTHFKPIPILSIPTQTLLSRPKSYCVWGVVVWGRGRRWGIPFESPLRGWVLPIFSHASTNSLLTSNTHPNPFQTLRPLQDNLLHEGSFCESFCLLSFHLEGWLSVLWGDLSLLVIEVGRFTPFYLLPRAITPGLGDRYIQVCKNE